MRRVFLKFAVFRIFSTLLVQTYFVPDEYWQSLEIAHFSVFRYGYRTWEYKEEIRCAVYPFLFAIIYKILQFLRLDNVACLIYVPRIFQAILSAFGDTCFFKWSRSFNLPTRNIWTVVVFDWFSFFCYSRTLINTFEANLVIFGIFTFPWRTLTKVVVNQPPPDMFAILVTTICFIRPTACLIWGPLCLLWFIQAHDRQLILKSFLVKGALSAFGLFLMDSIFYGHFTFTPWNFAQANIFKGVASFYGSHPFHWYLTQGLPVVLGSFTLPFLLQVFQTLKSSVVQDVAKTRKLLHKVNTILLITISFSIFGYSLISHKEFRFLLSLQPMMLFLAIQGLAFIQHGVKRKIFWIVSIVTFCITVLLFGQFHQRGSLTVMKSLSNDAAMFPNETSLLFLMPCHSTPLYSHLHVQVPARFITCDPPLYKNSVDESQVFYANPKKWVVNFLTENSPSHVIMFDHLVSELSESFMIRNFSVHEKHFHTLFPDGRVGKNIYIYRENRWPVN